MKKITSLLTVIALLISMLSLFACTGGAPEEMLDGFDYEADSSVQSSTISAVSGDSSGTSRLRAS